MREGEIAIVTRERDDVVQGIEIENGIDVIVPIPTLLMKVVVAVVVVTVGVVATHVVRVLLRGKMYKGNKQVY